MKFYRKLMQVVTWVENFVLAASMLLVLALTFGNVVARKLFSHSWGFTEEITVAAFVLISLLGAGVASGEGGLVNLNLVPDRVSPAKQRVLRIISAILCLAYSIVLTYEGIGRMIDDHTLTPILHIPKFLFWGFVVIGGISLTLHLILALLNDLSGRHPAGGSAPAEGGEKR